MDDLPYIFIIGFNKTATRALHHFFTSHGFPGVHWDQGKLALAMHQNLIDGKRIFAGYDHLYKVFSDMFFASDTTHIEANAYFRNMDRDYPGSFFIFNNRDTEKWLTSRINHSVGEAPSLKARSFAFYKTRDESRLKEIWRGQKQRFEQDVRDYFSGCERFLEIDIERDDVCSSIGKLLAMELDCARWKILGPTEKPAGR